MNKILKLMTIIVIFFGITYEVFIYFSSKELNIYFLDVGQGDAILIETPDKKYALIDGGPDSKVLSELGEVLPFWVRKLDLVILTHPDADHLVGLTDVLETYKVEQVDTTGVSKDTVIYKKFANEISQYQISNVKVNEDSDFSLGCCTNFDILWPVKNIDAQSIEPVNNTSASIVLKYGDYKLFLAGDIESATEKELVKKYDLSADFLKVSHHGSTTSSTEDFLEELHPSKAFISVGTDNKFGHPKQEILERLSNLGIQVYRTDTMGRIKLTLDDNNYKIICEISCVN